MIRRSWLLALLSLAGLLATAPLWSPPALRRVGWFDVERVEVAGARMLAPHEVLSSAGVRRGQSVWEDSRAWRAALLEHPAIEDVRITRKLPGTLRIRVLEKEPVAYVLAGTLRPATAEGEILPVDPSRAPIDLPILRPAATGGGSAHRRELGGMLEEVGRLSAIDPGLMARVSEVRTGDGTYLLLALSEPWLEVMLPAGASAARLGELRAVLADVERRDRPVQDLAPTRVDLRFADQVVVRHPSPV